MTQIDEYENAHPVVPMRVRPFWEELEGKYSAGGQPPEPREPA